MFVFFHELSCLDIFLALNLLLNICKPRQIIILDMRESFDVIYKHSSFCTSFLDIDNKFLFSLFKGEKTAGINVRRGCITNILEENVVQPVLVCTTAITQATETVRAILKIDDIVQCR